MFLLLTNDQFASNQWGKGNIEMKTGYVYHQCWLNKHLQLLHLMTYTNFYASLISQTFPKCAFYVLIWLQLDKSINLTTSRNDECKLRSIVFKNVIEAINYLIFFLDFNDMDNLWYLMHKYIWYNLNHLTRSKTMINS